MMTHKSVQTFLLDRNYFIHTIYIQINKITRHFQMAMNTSKDNIWNCINLDHSYLFRVS